MRPPSRLFWSFACGAGAFPSWISVAAGIEIGTSLVFASSPFPPLRSTPRACRSTQAYGDRSRLARQRSSWPRRSRWLHTPKQNTRQLVTCSYMCAVTFTVWQVHMVNFWDEIEHLSSYLSLWLYLIGGNYKWPHWGWCSRSRHGSSKSFPHQLRVSRYSIFMQVDVLPRAAVTCQVFCAYLRTLCKLKKTRKVSCNYLQLCYLWEKVTILYVSVKVTITRVVQ